MIEVYEGELSAYYYDSNESIPEVMVGDIDLIEKFAELYGKIVKYDRKGNIKKVPMIRVTIEEISG